MTQAEVSRRTFMNTSLAAAGALAAVAATTPGVAGAPPAAAAVPTAIPKGDDEATARPAPLPCGMLGKAKISRLLLGGNLVGGWMHARDLKYVDKLFKAYATEEKIMQTLKLADEHGINTVFETGANFVERYNRECKGHMQFIPHIQVKREQSEQELKDHIKAQVDSGACAVYVWGVASDQLVMMNAGDKLARAVELAKVHGLPVGVGSHSLLVPMECEKRQAPVDFYVKTLHKDDYPSATAKPQRKEFIWLTGGTGWYDNMWCINPEETIAFMKTVNKPWIAFKILAAGAIPVRDGMTHAFSNGADFAAVGMFDFQVAENAKMCGRVLKETQKRERPWYG